jgi:hypothetical protein
LTGEPERNKKKLPKKRERGRPDCHCAPAAFGSNSQGALGNTTFESTGAFPGLSLGNTPF